MKPQSRNVIIHLTGRINNLRSKLLALILDELAEGVLDGRVVALDEVAVDELHREGRLAWMIQDQLT